MNWEHLQYLPIGLYVNRQSFFFVRSRTVVDSLPPSRGGGGSPQGAGRPRKGRKFPRAGSPPRVESIQSPPRLPHGGRRRRRASGEGERRRAPTPPPSGPRAPSGFDGLPPGGLSMAPALGSTLPPGLAGRNADQATRGNASPLPPRLTRPGHLRRARNRLISARNSRPKNFPGIFSPENFRPDFFPDVFCIRPPEAGRIGRLGRFPRCAPPGLSAILFGDLWPTSTLKAPRRDESVLCVLSVPKRVRLSTKKEKVVVPLAALKNPLLSVSKRLECGAGVQS
jgi:hypothetical protein